MVNIDEKKIEEVHKVLDLARREMASVIVGQKRLIDRLLIVFLAEGHALLEGVPGIAKTKTAQTFSHILDLDFKRIQFTPDLLPSDILGTEVYNPKSGLFSVEKGPIFTNVVLVDEINRAPPKVQSALLEVMQEKQVTIGGTSFLTGSPFFVIATQNPIEQEGTYPLPEAEVDRFMMKIFVDYPSFDEEREIVSKMAQKSEKLPAFPPSCLTLEAIQGIKALMHEVYIDERILDYILSLVTHTRTKHEGLLDYGASPRASIYLTLAAKAHALLEGRGYVTPYDIKEVACDVLRHRLILSYEALSQDVTADTIVEKILSSIKVP